LRRRLLTKQEQDHAAAIRAIPLRRRACAKFACQVNRLIVNSGKSGAAMPVG
jgi:hypothetical protein